MIKIFKYLKRYWLIILFISGLLFISAQTELALPDYMSTIINKGIQNGGIENSVMEVISAETYSQIQLFLKEEQIELMDEAYTFKTFDQLSEKLQKRYPNASNVYELNELSLAQKNNLNQAIQEAVFLVYVFNYLPDFEGFDQNTKLLLEEIPDGISIFDFLKTLPTEQFDEITKTALSSVKVMGDSVIVVGSTSAVKQEYTILGRNLDSMQLNYIADIGFKMLIIALIGGISFISVTFLSSRLAGDLSKNLRKDIFNKVQHFSISEFNQFSTASLITRTTNDIQQIQNVVMMSLRTIIYAPILGFGAILRVINNSANMSWIIALTIFILLLVIILVFILVLPKFKVVQKLVDQLNLVMRENLSGMLVIRAFGKEKIRAEKFDTSNRDITNLNLFVNKAMNTIMPIMGFILNSVILLIVWVGAKYIDAGTLNVGDMMAFIQYSMQIIMAFIMIAVMFVMIPRAAVAANRVFDVLETPLSINDPINPQSFNQNSTGLIEFKNVSFAYPNADEEVLHDINFLAKPGEITAFIGSTGSGKSTLINLITRFYDVSSGQILIDNIDIKTVTQYELRELIGLVPQGNLLFKGTIASNLRFGNKEASKEILDQASKVAQATEFIQNKEDGYDSEIAQSGSNVSGGQKQRLSIARALVKNPKIYLFDDSFSALDFKTDAALRQAMEKLLKEKQSTMLVVGQRVSSIMNANQIIVLDNGKIVGKGSHQELMKSCEVYQEIAYSQLSKEELGYE